MMQNLNAGLWDITLATPFVLLYIIFTGKIYPEKICTVKC